MTARQPIADDSEQTADAPDKKKESFFRRGWVEPYVGEGRSRRRTPKAVETVAQLLARQRASTLATTFCVFIARLSPLVLPLLLRVALHPIVNYKPYEFAGRVWTPEAMLLFVLCASAAIAAIRALANFGFIALSGRSGHLLVSELRMEMFNHILRLPLSYTARRETGKIMLRFMGDSDALRLWISRTRPTVYVDLVMLVLISIAMVWVDRSLGMIALVAIPVVGFAIALYAPRLRTLTRTSRFMQAGFTGHVQARIDVIRESKWLDSMRGFRQMTRKLAGSIARQNAKRERVSAAISSLGEASLLVLLPPLVWFGVRRVWAETLTPGDLVALVWLAAHLGTSMQRLSSSIAVYQKAQVSLQRVVRLLGRPSERGRSTSLAKFLPKGQSIEFEDVVVGGDDASPISFKLQGPGICILDECAPLSSVFEALLGFEKIRQGRVLLDGKDRDDLSVPSVRAAMGWAPLRPAIFDVSVRENILMGKPRAKAEEIARAMTSLGIARQDADAWLDGLAGPNGRNLSDVERYEIGLLRTALRRPTFVFVEPVSDDALRGPLQNALRLWGDKALIVLDHSDSELVEG